MSINTSNLQEAIQFFREGRPVIIMDDENRENEGDLCIPAGMITLEHLRFFRQWTTNKLCVACSPRRTEELNLPLMEVNNTDPNKTPFTITVDLIGTDTGISTTNQWKTIRALADPTKIPSDFTRPGHVQPLRASPKGLYGRQGHTEASVELCKMAGVYPTCVIAEILKEDGEEARLPECQQLASLYKIPLISIPQLVASLPNPITTLPLLSGEVNITTYPPNYIILSKGVGVGVGGGELRDRENVPLRIHSECITGDIFGSQRCDCRSQLDTAINRLVAGERGILIYIRGHEGRGIGLENKLLAYSYQDTGKFDTVSANLELHLPIDARSYEGIPKILENLGVKSVMLFTNNLEKVKAVGKFLGCRVDDVGQKTELNRKYLEVKRTLHHLADIERKRIGIVYTGAWHTERVNQMVQQCREYLKNYTIRERVVSGSYELVMGARQLIEEGCQSVISIGILLRGETAHFDAILTAVSGGLMDLQLIKGIPIIFGVLACYTKEQIDERTCGSKNCVKEWCDAAIDMIK